MLLAATFERVLPCGCYAVCLGKKVWLIPGSATSAWFRLQGRAGLDARTHPCSVGRADLPGGCGLPTSCTGTTAQIPISQISHMIQIWRAAAGKNVSSFSFLWSAGFDLLLRGLEQSHSQSSLPLPRSWLKFPSRPTSSAAHLSYRFHGQCIRHSMQWSNEYVVLQLPRLLETVAGGPEEVKIN